MSRFKWLAAYTLVVGVALVCIFWGTWSCDATFVQPDCPTIHPPDFMARAFAKWWNGGAFVPLDVRYFIGTPYFWQELQYALGIYFAGLGMVYLLRVLSLPSLAAYTAGAAYALMGYNFTLFSAGHLGWFEFLAYGPFAFGLLHRALAAMQWRYWILLGATLAWAAARQPDLWLLFLLLLAAYGLCLFVSDFKRLCKGATFLRVAVCAVVMLLTGAPQFFNALFVETANREKQMDATGVKTDDDRYAFCTNWSLPPDEILEFIVPDVNGGSSDPRVSLDNPYRGRIGMITPSGRWQPYRQHSLYFGILTVLLALVGVSVWRREKGVRFWAVAMVVTLFCAFGCFTPFYRLIYALPGGNLIRCPVKFVHLVEFCVAVLAGYGVARLYEYKVLRYVLMAVALINVIDLSRIDARYCAVQSLAFQRGTNDAAGTILSVGGGKVLDTLSLPNYLSPVGESFIAHGVESVTATLDKDTRFCIVDMRNLEKFKPLVKSGQFKHLASYVFTAQGIMHTTDIANASACLFIRPSLSAPVKEGPPPVKPITHVFAVISVLTSLFAGIVACLRFRS